MVNIPNRSQSAGIPVQYDDVITAVDVQLITGNVPDLLVEDLRAAPNLNLLALTVVGLDANDRIAQATSGAEATGVLTFTGVGTAAETVTIGSQVYTLRAAPTTVGNEVKIGATAAETAANLAAAINGSAGAGTLYGSATLPHQDVTASTAGAVLTVTSKLFGAGANAIATTETSAAASFGGATLAGGTVPAVRPIGIILADLVTDASGKHKGVPVYRQGCFNPDALVWHGSFSNDAEKFQAFRGAPTPTNIIIRRPKTASV